MRRSRKHYSLPHITNTAETYGIYEAVRIDLSSNSDNIVIISDSFSAITLIANPYPVNELVHLTQKIFPTSSKIISFLSVTYRNPWK